MKLEPFFQANEILEDQVKYDDLIIINQPEQEMKMNFYNFPIQHKHEAALKLGNNCQSRDGTELR